MDTVEQVDGVEALGGRIFEAALGAADLLSIYLGDRLGWYRSLAADGPCTAAELAGRTGTHERYAREWLEQQAVTGLLTARADGRERRFTLPAASREVLLDPSSLNYLAPVARMLAASAAKLPQLLQAYRTGGGVSWDDLGPDARESQADLNRPWFEQRLGTAVASVPELDEAMRRPGARIADLGCGGGWSSIALARAYPDATIDGIDVDAGSVDMARKNAAGAGVADRVTFTHADAAGLTDATYDAVFAFECVHDMPRPVDVLAAVERALTPDGFVVVMDEAVAETFSAPGDDLERIMYGFSLLVCLPDGMSSPPSAGTGTVMRPDTLRRYAQEAGLTSFEILPIEDFGFWRFYRLAR
jgi:2-polyprenyl-3-methyl-5-hydroxy-6-metoxy-1,4-benzoquinol methylase